MCPFCIGTVLWAAVGAASLGGAVAVGAKLRTKAEITPQQGEQHDNQ